MPSARECAAMLLETIPSLMRSLHGALRQKQEPDGELHTMGQFRMLGMLGHAPRTLSELAAMHQVTPSTMSRSIELLVRKGWVARQPDPQDRRQVILSLTDDGRAAHAAMLCAIEDTVTQLLEQLDDREREQLYDGLDILHSLLDRAAMNASPTESRCPQ